METSYVGAYWGDRPASALESAERLSDCLGALAAIHPSLRNWFQRGARRAASKVPVRLDEQSLAPIITDGGNRRDFGSDVIDELGYSFGFWNRTRPTVGVSGTVGAHAAARGVVNSFVLDFPPYDETSASIYIPEVAASLFEAVVEAWVPEWATWTTPHLRASQESAPREPVVGWMTYVRGGPIDAVLAERVQALGDGIQIWAASEFSAVDDVVVGRVRQGMESASLIHAIP